jgi:hypothetical protein
MVRARQGHPAGCICWMYMKTCSGFATQCRGYDRCRTEAGDLSLPASWHAPIVPHQFVAQPPAVTSGAGTHSVLHRLPCLPELAC